MLNLIKKLFGSKHDKDIKEIMPLVDEINDYYKKYDSLSEEELKGKTQEFKEHINKNVKALEDEQKELNQKLREEALDARETQSIYDRLKVIDQEIFDTIDNSLDEILTQAFAVVKQTCKRLSESKYTYEYVGQKYTWDMIPYDVQLIGGIVLHQGKISEMATGEGKTLVAILPLYLNALSGRGAHLVTVNDYLAKRDCDWMRPVYEYLGLSVCSIQSNMDPRTRDKYYNYDITYGTNNEFGFDYLRDNMVVQMEDMVQRPHWYAIVDEVDSVLIDEARTPLIISGAVGKTADKTFNEMNPRVKKLVQQQLQMLNKVVNDATKLLESDKKEDLEEAGVKMLLCHRGAPKHKRLQKLMQEPEYQNKLKETELFYLREQGRKMHIIDEQLYYTIDEKNHQVDISEMGRELLSTSQEDPNAFVIPDIATELNEIESDRSLSEQEKQLKKDQAHVIFAQRSDRIHTINQLLRAYSLYEKDVEYVIQNGKIMIVDEHTGRILEGRRYSDGLHQAIEAKENVKVERDTQTLATITLQNYFRLYKKLAGMTGTAETEAAEFEKIYKLDTVVIPTNKPIQRDDRDDLIYRTSREKLNAIIEEIQTYLKEGRAILVGTASVEMSEKLSKMLQRQRIPHNVLNAKQHQKEAEIVTTAGKKGAVTIATNMAGRGTDIKLDPEVKKNGGLVIIGSERHDSRRIDRQLRGRSGRQGDPGGSQFFISLEDNLMRLFGGDRMSVVMQKLKVPEGEPIQHSMITKQVERAQKKVEENNFAIRKRLLDYDDVMNQQRTVIYDRRKHALNGERLKGDIFDNLEGLAGQWYDEFHPHGDFEGLQNTLRSSILCELKISADDFKGSKREACVEKVIETADEFYNRKEEMLGSEFMGQLERFAVLQTIDDKWKDHLRLMDDIKEGINLRAYGQKNPILEYKGEAFKYFAELIEDINKEAINIAFKFFPKMAPQEQQQQQQAPAEEIQVKKKADTNVIYKHDSAQEVAHNQAARQAPNVEAHESSKAGPKVQTERREQPKVGRNEPCPCGSGKKYKKCCGRDE